MVAHPMQRTRPIVWYSKLQNKRWTAAYEGPWAFMGYDLHTRPTLQQDAMHVRRRAHRRWAWPMMQSTVENHGSPRCDSFLLLVSQPDLDSTSTISATTITMTTTTTTSTTPDTTMTTTLR
ncbi:hypothetical protein IAQ61_006733 [Plenodomus lingam]|uniref:uncharacterized protein n=1 Tax=Leptosphaeria maculans TaxID=5022 RepID=UPI0033346A23|nr:hypothetical protein IAQ61_006733 [Plenodomus lingam]